MYPETIRIFLLRFSFFNDLSTIGTESEVVRVASIINSINLLWENNAFLTGMGYGSWYDDSYFPMLNLSNSAFDDDSLVAYCETEGNNSLQAFHSRANIRRNSKANTLGIIYNSCIDSNYISSNIQ